MDLYKKFDNYLSKPGWLWLATLIVFGIIFLPLFAGWRVLARDTLTFTYPFFYFFKSAFQAGQSIVWNPGVFSGFPQIATLTSIFSPVVYGLLKIFSPITSYNLTVFFYSIGGAVFTALLLRRFFGISPIASFLAGLVFVVSQWYNVVNLTLYGVILFLPFILWLQFKAEGSPPAISFASGEWRAGKRWPWLILGGLTFGITIISSIPDFTVMVGLAGLLLALALGKRNPTEKFSTKPLLTFLGMGLIGLAVSVFQTVPTFIMSQLSSRAGGLTALEATNQGLTPFDVIRFVFPYFDVPFISLSFGTLYLGVIPLILLIVALIKMDKRTRPSFFWWLFWLGLALAVIKSPFLWLIHHLPPFNYIHFGHRFSLLVMFAGSALSAYGFDWLMQNVKIYILRKNAKRLIVWLTALITFGVIGVTLAVNFFSQNILSRGFAYFENNIFSDSHKLPLEYYQSYITKIFNDVVYNFDLANLTVAVPFLIILISVFSFFYFLKKKNPAILLIVILLNVISVPLASDYTIPKKAFAEVPPVVSALKEFPLGKIFSLFNSTGEFEKVHLQTPGKAQWEDINRFRSNVLVPNIQLNYGLTSADYYDPLMARSMGRLLAYVGSDTVTVGERFGRAPVSAKEKIEIFNERKWLLDHLGVNYIVSPYKLTNGNLSLTKEVEGFYIYENPDAVEEIYFATRVETMPEIGEEEQYFALLEARPAPGEVVVFCDKCDKNSKSLAHLSTRPTEGSGDISSGEALRPAQGKGEVNFIEKSNGILKIQTNTTNPELLVFTQNNLPGWIASVDGQPTDILNVNSTFMGVVVPKGEHTIEFRYDYWSLIRSFFRL